MYKCEILADSISPQGHRITTYKVTYPRIIHAEMCRHRTLSRNSASSRAIPFKKMVQMVEEDPFIPIAWQKDHKGMQGTEYWTDDDTVTVDEGDEYERYTKIYSATEHFITEWLEARDLAIAQSYELNRLGVTKQLCNRLLEPFMWHTELITGTEWENFFELRCPQYNYLFDFYKSKKDVLKASKDGKYNDGRNLSDFTTEDWLRINSSQAEIHIQAIAEMMWDAMNESTPKQLQEGEYHIPFGGNIDLEEWYNSNKRPNSPYYSELEPDEIDKCFIKIATARCARISYETLGDNPKIDYESDIKLHDMLLRSKHMSPFEHCARAMSDKEYRSFVKGELELTNSDTLYQNDNAKGWCRNFRGFIPYRHMIE